MFSEENKCNSGEDAHYDKDMVSADGYNSPLVEDVNDDCSDGIRPQDHPELRADNIGTPSMELNTRDNVDQSDNMGDAAALFVWLYLLLISTISIGAIAIGCFVVVQYGFVVLVATLTAIIALAVVGATMMSAITGDTKLTKARSTVDAWHIVVKDTIFEEIGNLKEDITAWSDRTLLLTNDSSNENIMVDRENTEEICNLQHVHNQQHTKKQYKPKSLLFKYVVSPLSNMRRKKQRNSGKSLFNIRRQKETHLNSEEHIFSPSGYVPPVV